MISARTPAPSPRIMLLNGPNLNLLGEREPHLYGRDTLADIEKACNARAKSLGYNLDFRQSNFEGVLVESIHEARKTCAALIINPAGLSFYSIALLDALKTFDGPKVELHLTNIHARDPLYRNSIMSQAVTSVICGLGAGGYPLAIEAVVGLVAKTMTKTKTT
jgi:3-dehydroquinate dehydratase II